MTQLLPIAEHDALPVEMIEADLYPLADRADPVLLAALLAVHAAHVAPTAE